MKRYQESYWGYEVTLSNGWIHRTIKNTEAFALNKEALKPEFQGPEMGYVLIRGEWNALNKEIEPLWNKHITRTAIMLGAKKLGSAPWILPSGSGFEAEILLPQKTERRLWVGILENNARILHFMVVHSREERSHFEPLATSLISSLQFLRQINPIVIDELGLPLPPKFNLIDPKIILTDIADLSAWKAYKGPANVDALQAFFSRELPVHGWKINEFISYPSASELGFARLNISQAKINLTLGIFPPTENTDQGRFVIKKNQGK